MSRLGMKLGLALAVLAAGPVSAEPGEDRDLRDLPQNAPARCPYCGGDAARMTPAGVVSHGGFEFGASDTAAIDAAYPTADIRWIESEHLQLGIAISARKIGSSERKSVVAELTRLAEVLPEVNPKTRALDPWLLTHLYVQRLEDVYARFVEVMGIGDVTFPDGTKLWDMTGTYLGEGPYLGQKGKYELIVWPSQQVHTAFLEEQFGLRIQMSQRWNVLSRDTLLASVHIADGNLRDDPALHNHLAFNLAHNLLNGYKHYSYDIPLWLHLGLSHWIERSIDPRYNSFDSSEGAVARKTGKADWTAQVKKLHGQDKLPRMAELMALRSYADVDLADNFSAWSRVAFLIERHPEGFACLIGAIKGIMDATGHPDGRDIGDRHRQAMQQCLDWSYAQFDEAWSAWVTGAAQD